MKKRLLSVLMLGAVLFASCGNKTTTQDENTATMQQKVDEFAMVQLTTDVNKLNDKEKQLINIFFDIAEIMDELFWMQSYGDKADMEKIQDPATREFAMINYGPWERLDGMRPFVDGYGEKPLGANFYPKDMTKEEYDALQDENKGSLYTVIRRGEDGKLQVKWYREEYKAQIDKVCALLDQAIPLAEDAGLKKYLEERKKAFQTDDYFASDMAWMDMKSSHLDFVVGPIENYEDRLFGAKAAYEAFILVKDEEESAKLAKFTAMLPQLQKELPCDPKFKQEVPGTESDLNVYDVIYYGGDCNSGSKTIAINLPNDERVQLEKGARRLQLKNAMKAKFDKILYPIAENILSQEQLAKVKFDAFFYNVTFHEVAHGLGIKNTINGKGGVRQALGNQYSSWEEAKADILGLFMVCSLIDKGEITSISKEDAVTTFIAGILRSVRFGAASAHGVANMMCFNYFEDNKAFTKNAEGIYTINYDNAFKAINSWAAKILEIEGTGDIDGAKAYADKNGQIRKSLQETLDVINGKSIPKDIRYEQGKKVLGL
ncbi:MAG: Zn-dependent hydrolase [Bacteroidales bacterium]|nr:Zn-dependent hydrolase [Bacteroidales bacterium]